MDGVAMAGVLQHGCRQTSPRHLAGWEARLQADHVALASGLRDTGRRDIRVGIHNP